MDEASIKILLSRLQCRRIKGNTRWVNATCPLAFKTHPKGRDSHPSFGVSINPSERSHFRCHSCQRKGSLLDLVWFLSSWGNDPDRFANMFHWVIARDMSLLDAKNRPEEDSLEGLKSRFERAAYRPFAPKTEFISGPSVVSGIVAEDSWQELPEVPPAVLEALLKRPLEAKAQAYLNGVKRQLTQEALDVWEIGYHPIVQRISIPIRDHKSRLVGMSGRLLEIWDPDLGPKEDKKAWIETGKGPKFLHSDGFRRDFILYGEHKIERRGVRGYIVEGFFDVIGLWQCGFRNAVALMGTYPSRQQVEKIVHYFKDVVVVPDGDAAGREMGPRVVDMLTPFLPTYLVQPPEGLDPDDLARQYAQLLHV